jgi:tetratricopeptide (TPR) repeat protein
MCRSTCRSMCRSWPFILSLLLLAGMLAGPVAAEDRGACPNAADAKVAVDCNDPWFTKSFDRAFADRRHAPVWATKGLEPGIAAGISDGDRGACENWKNAVETAIAACGRLIASSNLPARELSNVYWWRGLALSSSARNDQANLDFDQAIKADPTNAGPFFSRGYFYFFQAGDPARSIAYFGEAIRNNPRFGSAYGLRAQAYEKTGQFAKALVDYQVALEVAHADIGYTAAIRNLREKLAASGEAELPVVLPPPADPAAAPPPQSAPPALRMPPMLYRPAPGAPVIPPPRVARPQPPTAMSPPALQSPPQPTPTIGPATGQRRLALVIGNGAYAHSPRLPNPPNDAHDLAAALRDLGFQVIEGYDLNGAAMRAKIIEFGGAMKGADVTLLFYSGHGMQVDGRNYLVPVDAKLEQPSALGLEAIDVGSVLADMEMEKRTNLVFLDACRDNPLSRSLARSFGATRSSTVGQGLAHFESAVGTLIAFATDPGNVALDGTGRNSPFTAALLRHIRTPNIEIESMLKAVRVDVMQMTHDKQVPWDHSSLTADFYFKTAN